MTRTKAREEKKYTQRRAMNMKSLRTGTAENHITFSISTDGEERSMLCIISHYYLLFFQQIIYGKPLLSGAVSVNCPGYMNVNKSLWAPR